MFKQAKKVALVAAALGLMAAAAKAEDAKTISLGYSGYIDSNYTEDLNSRNGGFSINQFGIDINAADSAYGIKGGLSLVNDSTSNDIYTRIDLAFVDKSFFNGMLEAKLGRFYTPIGYEVVPAYKNANETSSLLFNNEPTTHDGLILTYNPLKSLSASVFVANDTNYGQGYEMDSYIDDAGLHKDSGIEVDGLSYNGYSPSKDYGAQVTYALGNLNLAVNYLFSDLGDNDYTYIWNETSYTYSYEEGYANIKSHLINLVGTYKLNDSLSFGGEYLYKTTLYTFIGGGQSEYYNGHGWVDNAFSNSSKTSGYSLYTTYTLGSLSINPRFTQMFDPDQVYLVDGNGYNFSSIKQEEQYTLTFKYPFGSLVPYLEGNVFQTDSHTAFSNGGNVQGPVGITSKVLAGASYQF